MVVICLPIWLTYSGIIYCLYCFFRIESSAWWSVWLCWLFIPCIKMLFTRLSSKCSQLHTDACFLIREWKTSSDPPPFCRHLKNWNLSNVSFLVCINASLSCSTSASVVHFWMSVCGNLWWKMFFACAPNERYMCLFVLLSASSHGVLSIWGPFVLYFFAGVSPVGASFDISLFSLPSFGCCFVG